MFELRHLRAYVVICEELHFGRAAQRLNMTQPPLSQLLKQLEAHVGVELVRRTTRSVELTAAGQVFLDKARAILAAAASAPNEARRAGQGEVGRLVLGFVPSASYQFLAPMITAYRKAFPDVELQFKEMVSVRQIEALRRSAIDIALLRPPFSGPDLESTVVLREQLVAAVPARHPLARHKAIDVRDLHQARLVAFDPDESPYFSHKVQDLFAQYDVQPLVVQHAVLPSMLAFVAAGVGVAMVPASVRSAALKGVVFKPLAAPAGKGRGMDRVQRAHSIELSAVWLAGRKTVLIENWLAAIRPLLASSA